MDPYLELFRDGHASLMLPPESIPKDNHLRINGSDGVSQRWTTFLTSPTDA